MTFLYFSFNAIFYITISQNWKMLKHLFLSIQNLNRVPTVFFVFFWETSNEVIKRNLKKNWIHYRNGVRKNQNNSVGWNYQVLICGILFVRVWFDFLFCFSSFCSTLITLLKWLRRKDKGRRWKENYIKYDVEKLQNYNFLLKCVCMYI